VGVYILEENFMQKIKLRIECTAQLAEEIKRELALADCPLAEILKKAEIISVDKPKKDPK
jgi:hypothetical protein